jgi:hypothetical protein
LGRRGICCHERFLNAYPTSLFPCTLLFNLNMSPLEFQKFPKKKKKILNNPTFIPELLLFFVFLTRAKDADDIPKLAVSAMGRNANRFRHENYYQGVCKKVRWSFTRHNAGDFIRYVRDEYNATDEFYNLYFNKWRKMDVLFRESILKLTVSELTKKPKFAQTQRNLEECPFHL